MNSQLLWPTAQMTSSVLLQLVGSCRDPATKKLFSAPAHANAPQIPFYSCRFIINFQFAWGARSTPFAKSWSHWIPVKFSVTRWVRACWWILFGQVHEPKLFQLNSRFNFVASSRIAQSIFHFALWRDTWDCARGLSDVIEGVLND